MTADSSGRECKTSNSCEFSHIFSAYQDLLCICAAIRAAGKQEGNKKQLRRDNKKTRGRPTKIGKSHVLIFNCLKGSEYHAYYGMGADILTGFHRKDILDEGSVADISSDSVPVDAYGYVINNFDSGDRIDLSKFEQDRCRT
jgi:hypothetical protein